MYKLVLQFVISGAVVVAATALAERLGQKWAGLLVALPLWTLLTYIFLSVNHPAANYRGYLTAAVVFMIPAAVFILCLLALSGRAALWASLTASFAAYVVVAYAVSRTV